MGWKMLAFLFLFSPGRQPVGQMFSTFRVGLPYSFNLSGITLTDISRGVFSMTTLNAVKLTSLYPSH